MPDMLDEMIDRALHHAGAVAAVLPQLRIQVRPQTTDLTTVVYTPKLCIVLQGAKQVMIGDQVLRYDQASYFVSSFDLPGTGRVVEASPDRPYIGISLAFDMESVTSLIPRLPPVSDCPAQGFGIAPITRALLDPWCRLLRLLDEPEDAPVLAPLLEREILYRLLREPAGLALRQLASGDSQLSRLRRVIGWIRANYEQPLRIEQLAAMAGMSTASFHRHFKTATGTSPLRFQKTVRLQQARLQLLAREKAASVGYAVGYESLSQFTREYARMFGAPPVRDARRIAARLDA